MGSRQNTYLRLSVFVARFGEYTDAVIDHLLETKVRPGLAMVTVMTGHTV